MLVGKFPWLNNTIALRKGMETELIRLP